jgi:hypothetical protein
MPEVRINRSVVDPIYSSQPSGQLRSRRFRENFADGNDSTFAELAYLRERRTSL